MNIGCPLWSESLDSTWDANCQNPYLRKLLDSRGLKLKNPKTVTETFLKDDVMGLFQLFLTPSRMQCLAKWTSGVLEKKGKRPVNLTTMKAFIGLEMAIMRMLVSMILFI